MTGFVTATGQALRLGGLLGKGGEGAVHEVDGHPGLAAKLYLPGLAAERQDKVLAMVQARWHASGSFVAFPIDALFEARGGTFAGFTMRKVGGHKPVHQLYSPTGRKTAFPKATYPLLVRTVSNVARAMASVHATGCVVGDVNHSGVLVAKDATVTLIDADSFQVSQAGRRFPCKVGVPEFTPPELQGQPLDQVVRTANHDAFGLAVLVFYTLMMGRHPFAGRYRGAGDMPMDRAIREFRFAYSARTAVTEMDPPPHVPRLQDLPAPVADALERAFGPQGASPAGRPTAAEWVSLLDRAETELVRCGQNGAHHFFRTAADCPWCRMERAYLGFIAFVPAVPPGGGGGAPAIDLGQLIAAVRGIPDPGPAPDLASLMPAPPPPILHPAVATTRRERLIRWALGGAGAAVGLGLLLGGWSGPSLFGLFAIAAGSALAFRPPASVTAFHEAAERARAAWSQAENGFRHAAGNEHFHRVRRDAEAHLQQLQALGGEEARRLAELEAKRRDSQMRRHLERFTIDKAKIRGLAYVRKTMLKSYGVETAADIERHRIEAIDGFGPATADNLLAWRRTAEAKFVYNPNLPVDPQEIAAVKADVARRRSDTRKRLDQTIVALRQAERDATALRAKPGTEAVQTFLHLRQVEADIEALRPAPREIASFIGAAALALVVVVALSKINGLGPPPAPSRPQPVATAPSGQQPAVEAEVPRVASGPEARPPPAIQPRADPEPPPLPAPPPLPPTPQPVPAAPSPLLNLLSRDEAAQVQQRLATLGYLAGAADGVWGPRSRAALKEFRRTNGLGADDRWDAGTQGLLLSGTALPAGSPPVVGAPATPSDTVHEPPPGATRHPLNRVDAFWIQARLRELGFYELDGEGIWGGASREALRDFKAVNGLPVDDSWDAATERALEAPAPVRARQTYIGGYATSRAECTGAGAGRAPVTIRASRAETAGGACDFEDVQRERPGSPVWLARARCAADGRSWEARVRLTLEAETLTWASERGVTVYHRCR